MIVAVVAASAGFGRNVGKGERRFLPKIRERRIDERGKGSKINLPGLFWGIA